MRTRLIRELAPAVTLTSDTATPSERAMSHSSARFASPLLGAARTRALRTVRPSARASIPSIPSRPPLAVSRTASSRPVARTVHGRGFITALEHVGVDVADDDFLEEIDDEN